MACPAVTTPWPPCHQLSSPSLSLPHPLGLSDPSSTCNSSQGITTDPRTHLEVQLLHVVGGETEVSPQKERKGGFDSTALGSPVSGEGLPQTQLWTGSSSPWCGQWLRELLLWTTSFFL